MFNKRFFVSFSALTKNKGLMESRINFFISVWNSNTVTRFLIEGFSYFVLIQKWIIKLLYIFLKCYFIIFYTLKHLKHFDSFWDIYYRKLKFYFFLVLIKMFHIDKKLELSYNIIKFNNIKKHHRHGIFFLALFEV